MTRISIPDNAWIKYRKNGRTLFGRNHCPIVWMTTPPPKGTEVYVLGWVNGQQPLTATKIITA